MNDERLKLNRLEAFLADMEGESKADDLADLKKLGLDGDTFLARVEATVQQGYSQQLRVVAASQRAHNPAVPAFLKGLASMSRQAMLDCFERLRNGEFGDRYRNLALARCRNKDASELTDDELRSWLEDAGQVLGEPES